MTSANPRIAVTPPAIHRFPALKNDLLKRFPDTVFNQTGNYFQERELVEFINEAEAVVVGRDPVSENVLKALPNLRMVSKYGVGLDNIDQEALKKRGVKLGFTPGVNRTSVAELTLCFMLGLFHNVFKSGFALKRKIWEKDGGCQLNGKIAGIIGCGNIGKEVVRLLQPFGCKVLVRDILDMSEFCFEHGAEEAGFEELISQSDIVSLHVPLTADTRNLINMKVLRRMKPGAFLVNTSRGEIVKEQDLKAALMDGAIAGAALDVFAQEPPEDPELLDCPNLMVTPHIGGNAVEAVQGMFQEAVGHIVAFFGK